MSLDYVFRHRFAPQAQAVPQTLYVEDCNNALKALHARLEQFDNTHLRTIQMAGSYPAHDPLAARADDLREQRTEITQQITRWNERRELAQGNEIYETTTVLADDGPGGTDRG